MIKSNGISNQDLENIRVKYLEAVVLYSVEKAQIQFVIDLGQPYIAARVRPEIAEGRLVMSTARINQLDELMKANSKNRADFLKCSEIFTDDMKHEILLNYRYRVAIADVIEEAAVNNRIAINYRFENGVMELTKKFWGVRED